MIALISEPEREVAGADEEARRGSRRRRRASRSRRSALEDDEIEHRRGPHRDVGRRATAAYFASTTAELDDRRGHQRLDRAAAALLGEEAHRHRRQRRRATDRGGWCCRRTPGAASDRSSCCPAFAKWLTSRKKCMPCTRRNDGDEHPRERRDEEREELALEDRPEAPHDEPPPSALVGSLALSALVGASRVSSAKTSSSELFTGSTSRTKQPGADERGDRLLGRRAAPTSSSFLLHEQRQRVRPPLGRAVVGRASPSRSRRRRARAPSAASRFPRTTMREPGASGASLASSSIVPSATSLPARDDDDAAAARLDLAEDVRREEDGVLLAELADDVADLADLVRDRARRSARRG